MSKILIIEDDQVVANIYRNKLVVEGYKVECAPDGETGLEVVKTFQPDAIILDLMLPGISGLDVLKQLRADASYTHLPVVVLSNTYLTSMVQEAWKAGANKCLSKASSTPKSVMDVIRGLVQSGDRIEAPKPVQPYSHVAHPNPTTPSASRTRDEALQFELSSNFLRALPGTLTKIRTLHQNLVRAKDDEGRKEPIEELYREIHTLTGAASLAGLPHVSQMAEALEALAKELQDKPKTINSSTLRTLASAIDLIGVLGEFGAKNPGKIGAGAKVLVVDDDAISRRAVSYSLEKARLNSVAVEDPKAALDLLARNTYDLVVLDVDMPEVNGYELCSKLRGFSANKRTPVVFVTALNSFESRANSSVSGGNDFIGKPFLFIELGVKALVHIWRTRLTVAKAA
ncbi:MAG: response regulator [Verrucomicrobia bacterium]|jgi:DNA-binding response OmpR family regulator|nr:response regulator [Verrucomicrobiota bacterium]